MQDFTESLKNLADILNVAHRELEPAKLDEVELYLVRINDRFLKYKEKKSIKFR